MAEENNLSMAPRDFDRRPGGRDRGGYNEGAAWNRRPARRDMDIVDKELNRYQPAFDFVQRYPEGYGGQPTRRGGGGGRRGGGDRSGQIDRLIGAIEGMGRGGNVTNTFNPTFNPTNVNAGRDIRDTAILGGDNTAGRDIVGAGSGDVETGDGGGGNTVAGGPGGTVNQPVDQTPVDQSPVDETPVDETPVDETPVEKPGKYDEFINRTYNDLLGRDAGEEGKTYWSGDLESGQTEDQVISNIKLGDEYKNREMAKDLASSMEGKTYGVPGDRNASSSLGNINENSLDAWVGAGGALTQSSDADAAGYYEGIGDKGKAANTITPYSTPDDGSAGLTVMPTLSDRDEKIYDLYTDVMGRNPDTEGFKYWTGAGGEGMSLADIEASFRGSAEQKLRDNVSGTNNFVSTDDYIAGKQNRGVGESGATNEDRSSANVSGTADNFLANTNNVTISPSTGTNTSNTGPNPTISTSQAAIQNFQNTSPVASSSTSTDADTFLNNLYADLGINDGVVDEGGRNYWTEQLKNKSKAEVERDIKYAAANA